MIATRLAAPTLAFVTLALVPTVIHSYRGFEVDDGRRVAAIPAILEGMPSRQTDRRDDWVRSTLACTEWLERLYRVGNDEVRLFAGRSYDFKRLYHHPELALLKGRHLGAAGQMSLPGRPDVRVHVLAPRRTGHTGMAAYALIYDGAYIENPILFQLRTAPALLVSGRRPMTLLMASDRSGSIEDFANAPAARLLAAALRAYDATGPASPGAD